VTDSEVEIENLSLARIDEIESLLGASAFKPLRYLARELSDSLDDFWFRSIKDLLQPEKARGFLAIRNGEAVGIIIYSDNPWETTMMGKKAGVINHFVIAQSARRSGKVALQLLDHALQQALSSGMQFILGKAYTDDVAVIHALESRGFLLMDTVVDCYYDFRRSPLEHIVRPAISADVVLRLAVPEDRAELVLAARSAFQGHFGRFHADELIGREVATKIYEEWINSSMDGYADWIYVAEISGKIAGFSIWKRPSPLENNLQVRVGHYSISGIHPDYHGRGLFTALTYEGMKRMQEIAEIVEGPTHINNQGVQAGYAKLHWRVCGDARHSFHKWS
jgi:ribosomal protein S18 acetylase RimI-like enzyme